IEEKLRMQRGVPLKADNDFEMMTSDSFIKTFDQIIGGVFIVMIAISSVAFMVGGVGVMNIMLVAVTERTKEIGLRKAVGAHSSDIMWQSRTEAIPRPGAGGAAGLIFGRLLAGGITAMLPILAMDFPIWAAAFVFPGSVPVGLVFGLWPAVKAAN